MTAPTWFELAERCRGTTFDEMVRELIDEVMAIVAELGQSHGELFLAGLFAIVDQPLALALAVTGVHRRASRRKPPLEKAEQLAELEPQA